MATMRSITLAALLLMSTAPAVAAINEGRTAGGRPFVTGGIGQGEVEQLKQRADQFSLQLVVSSKAGAYLADMDVRIIGANAEKVLDTHLDAPWLLVDLTPGTYTVFVTHAGKVHERKVTLTAGKREQMVVQFDVPGDTAKSPAPAATK